MTRLTKPVGQAVKSHPPDAKYVQFLLNEWRRPRGLKVLAVDGIPGPLTDAAIRDFQKAETGVVDGRVDCDGPSIRRLEYLHIAGIASGVYSLEHYGIISMTPPARGPLTLSTQAVRYLTALRKEQG
ncbi:peptidoglycan-binding domain-containing protein [Reyranella sp.]|jgi:peptidoglycan hydrolase-like protein with peptidoglycan-binding domain|uniref:peptidoglycan-binding domain-containing protein n=1 Tax=Reyranella sp. TaxID=1929291 RepID=UPI00120986C3|nr:peptidoglycan-binding domain-containing protein [Reyranella sp.]TAJ84530.1 MAG: peptidoglycan-binding protein [Reyranella sp.]